MAINATIKKGVLSNCPLQSRVSKPTLTLDLKDCGWDSDLSPATTGPSSAASSVAPSMDGPDIFPTLQFPEVDRSYEAYHHETFLGPLAACSSAFRKSGLGESDSGPDYDGDEDGSILMPRPDDPERAYEIAAGNELSAELFDAVCPLDLNSVPVFLHGALARPARVASLLTDKSCYRTYEQAARMFPGELRASEPTTAAASGPGMLLFSTSIRERKVLGSHMGSGCSESRTKVRVCVDGQMREIDATAYVPKD